MDASAENLVRALGLIISNTSFYGSSHAVTNQSVDSFYSLLTKFLESGDVDFQITENGLTVNQNTVDVKTILFNRLSKHFEAREVTNFILKTGISREQCQAFLEVLTAKPTELTQLGGFRDALAAVGLDEVVSARKRLFVEVTEDEVVVDKEKIDKLSEAAQAAGGAGDGGDQAGRVQEILAFLHGEGKVSEEDAARQVRDLGGDADQLAELIMQAAEVRASASPVEQGETLGELVVAALRRTYQALTEDPSFHTQKSKQRIQRTLLLLERDLLDKLRKRDDPAAQDVEMAVKDAVEELSDDLTVDSLAQEYARKRNAIGASEKRLLRYLKRKGSEVVENSGLKERLAEGGLDDEEWHNLLIKSGVVPEAKRQETGGGLPGAGDGGLDVLRSLAALVKQLETEAGDRAEDGATRAQESDTLPESFRPPSPSNPEELVKENLKTAQAQVDRTMQHAETTIGTLLREVGGRADDEDAETAQPRLSRKRLFEILAEIGQELCQPLAVINCTVEMILGGSLGTVTDMQSEMLATAASSGEKLKILIDKLIAIAGTPRGLTVNTQIQARLYE